MVDNPGLENDPDIAAKLLASFLKCNESKIREALDEGDLAKARKLVNGGLPEFTDAFNINTGQNESGKSEDGEKIRCRRKSHG